jgi:hypothetical protein
VSKSNGRSWFGGANRSGTITVIEAPVSRNFRRRAKVTFFVVAGVVGLLAATVASHYMHPILGLLLGFALGIGAGAAVAAVVLVWPVLRVFWYWATEIVLGLGLVYGWQWLMTATNLYLSLAVVAVVVGVPAAFGPIRRRIKALTWCVVVRHRLRLCFAAFIVANRQGSLPLILIARPTPAGERVWVWLRPGLALSDLESRLDKLAVACWAKEVRVIPASDRYAALVRVDITRRNPLASTVDSPLPVRVPDQVPDFDDSTAPTSPGMPPVGLDLPDVPEESEDSASRPTRGRRPRNAPNSTAAPGSPDWVELDDDRYGNNADWA